MQFKIYTSNDKCNNFFEVFLDFQLYLFCNGEFNVYSAYDKLTEGSLAKVESNFLLIFIVLYRK